MESDGGVPYAIGDEAWPTVAVRLTENDIEDVVALLVHNERLSDQFERARLCVNSVGPNAAWVLTVTREDGDYAYGFTDEASARAGMEAYAKTTLAGTLGVRVEPIQGRAA